MKLMPLSFHKDRLISCRDLSLRYKDSKEPVFSNLSFELMQGDRVFLDGENGCGKTSMIKAILAKVEGEEEQKLNFEITGELTVAGGLKVSYINQDTSHLTGNLREYAKKQELDYTLLLSLLRQLDFPREQFVKDMGCFSEGQKKKVLIAASLLTSAHLYIWDEPLNYIDVFSRMQIEKLLLEYQPTMILVEHDVKFKEKIATKRITTQTESEAPRS